MPVFFFSLVLHQFSALVLFQPFSQTHKRMQILKLQKGLSKKLQGKMTKLNGKHHVTNSTKKNKHPSLSKTIRDEMIPRLIILFYRAKNTHKKTENQGDFIFKMYLSLCYSLNSFSTSSTCLSNCLNCFLLQGFHIVFRGLTPFLSCLA